MAISARIQVFEHHERLGALAGLGEPDHEPAMDVLVERRLADGTASPAERGRLVAGRLGAIGELHGGGRCEVANVVAQLTPSGASRSAADSARYASIYARALYEPRACSSASRRASQHPAVSPGAARHVVCRQTIRLAGARLPTARCARNRR